jgi:glycosyltransferase involved in cell wall biosynthesis
MGNIALAYARRNRIPVVFTAHQLPWFMASYFPRSFRPWIEKILWMYARWVLGRYSSVITPTQTVADIIGRRTGLKPKVISNGLDLQTFHPPLFGDDRFASRQKWNLPPRVPLLLHAGRLDSDKSVDQVIRAAAPALRESEAHLVIVGDGCQKRSLIQLCREMGIEQRVHFLGFVSVEDGLPEIYRMADIFITTSEIETQGLVLLEAAASGLPIVAVRATCIPEIVHDGVNGFLARPGDTDTFSDAIITLLNDTQRAHEMGMKGRVLAGEHDFYDTCTVHEKLYREVIWRMNRRPTEMRKLFMQLFTQWKLVKSLMGIK